MRIRRLLVILLMLPIFVIVLDKYLLGGAIRNAFSRAITSLTNPNTLPVNANVPIPCDTVSKAYTLQLTRANGTWHLVRSAQSLAKDTATPSNTQNGTPVSSAQLRSEADIAHV